MNTEILTDLGINAILQEEKQTCYDVNLKLTQDEVYFPDTADLESLANVVVNTNRTTILEFGCGWSSLVFSSCMKYLCSDFNCSINDYRRNNLFECHTVDSSNKYIEIARNRVSAEFLKHINFQQSDVLMANWNGRVATEYKSLPLINPDFIYVDAPNIYDVHGDINGWSTKHKDLMPMMCDLLKIEHYLTPKTIIVFDGRTANARFCRTNFQRNWDYKYCSDRDQHFFVLEEEPLGKYSARTIHDLYYKNGFWDITNL
jgi:hypothetical protein